MQKQEQVSEPTLELGEQKLEVQPVEMVHLVDIDSMNRACRAAGIVDKCFPRSYRTVASCDDIDRMGDDALSDKGVNSPW